ncbi:MAG TPA: 16S rRNA (uracil(1498)-N(3))-methyltransferase [Rhodopila sp.]|uniref:16S rRNA (uracil(1498)-N(3))-methyltransferase n=1 Tax=Rhodopila sp. TaxID=2480087 RepID=UPI002BD71BC1|nr:16S rRNA (uracil(1498)-N(3))-methyltransferase [Rhodopila sp.]HVY17286.1 16S rRNA (uracil(1498)-N(3))-methyltransferase [Rhodopila sp.]
MLRLFVTPPLAPSVLIEATENQAHYLGTVMRRSPGDDIHLFNGHDGEWSARIETLGRGKGLFRVDRLLRPQAGDTDVWLAFALLKRDTTDLVVQKATELGVAALLPVVTERTNAARVNEDRLRAIAVEAAEQSERMTVPMIQPPRKLADVLTFWPADRPLFAALERTDAPPIHPVPGPCGLLIGPEGGFGPRDYALLERAPTLRPVGLGPRILRAETAAIAGLALLQATGWR